MTFKNTLPKKHKAVTEAAAPTNAEQFTTPALLSEKQAAQYLGISVAYLRRARREGAPGGRTAGPKFVRLESFGTRGGRNGGRILYATKDLDEWLASLERKGVI
ncbi:MAG: helix-turn-helix domain-containing protein [Synergistaceae bacterium]|jgi:hypothetical protein|nr:helix-turn-helix domain-containing protein [Synergistaceae bacterium]